MVVVGALDVVRATVVVGAMVVVFSRHWMVQCAPAPPRLCSFDTNFTLSLVLSVMTSGPSFWQNILYFIRK